MESTPAHHRDPSSQRMAEQRVPRKSINCFVISRRKFITVLLTFTLVLAQIQNAKAGEEDPLLVSGENNPSVQSKSVVTSANSCIKPFFSEGFYYTSCSGYTTIPTENVPTKHEIQTLDMSNGNTLQTLTDGQLDRANLTKLFKLILKNCQILTIERGAFRRGENLNELDLTHNKIDTLDPQVFAELVNLKTLRLSHNLIYRFQDGTKFPPMPNLNRLDLDHCKLKSIPDNGLENLSELVKLDLRSNSLSTLSWKVFRKLDSLDGISLLGNTWDCDCNMRFLIEILAEKSLSNHIPQIECSIPKEDKRYLNCPPKIDNINYSNDKNEQVQLGDDVYFECTYSGYPPPTVKWLKDDKLIDLKGGSKADESSSGTPFPLSDDNEGRSINQASQTDNGVAESSSTSSRFKIRNNTHEILGRLAEDEQKRNYKFRQSISLREVNADDTGHYECWIENKAGQVGKKVFLNLTGLAGDEVVIGGVSRKGMAVWMWILIAVLCTLILVLVVLLVILAWRRREKEKQEGYRKEMHAKFKDSNVDLGEFIDMKVTSSSQQQKGNDANRSEGTTPLLDSKSENSTIVMSMLAENHLPDITHGNEVLLRNSQIYSPKPPPSLNGYPTHTDARKEFFARQISEPYMRPASAMSLSRPSAMNAAQRRYIFAQQNFQSEPVPGGEQQYAVPHMLPRSGSAMSMSALPESDLRRQLFFRQYSQPSYGVMAMNNTLPRRNPSTSSEPPQEVMSMGGYNYSTLPRRPLRGGHHNWSRPVSPTSSTCSSYSTLSWRPAMNPITGVFSDGVGARTGADGGSTLSLNAKTPDAMDSSGGIESISRAMRTPSGGGKVPKGAGRNPRLGHNRTPSSLTRGNNDFFSFEPIQEVPSSECASNLTLDKVSGQQVPYTTQSLAREPRYKKRKPPPISVLSAKLKEPSRAFDHLKGRSASPRNSAVIKGDSADKSKLSVEGADETSIQHNLTNGNNSLLDANGNASILESTIDEEGESPTPAKLPPKVPPPPPPKPKRSQGTEDDANNKSMDNINANVETVTKADESPALISDGTVV